MFYTRYLLDGGGGDGDGLAGLRGAVQLVVVQRHGHRVVPHGQNILPVIGVAAGGLGEVRHCLLAQQGGAGSVTEVLDRGTLTAVCARKKGEGAVRAGRRMKIRFVKQNVVNKRMSHQ